MTDPYLGEIRMVAFNFNPRHWTDCSGQLLAIGSNQALYSILGTTYGGDGRTTFALPDLRGRVPIGVGQVGSQTDRSLGSYGGEESVAPDTDETPSHQHTLRASSANADQVVPEGHALANNIPIYGTTTTGLEAMAPQAVSTVTGAAHENMGPSLTVRFIICVEDATFPPRN